MATLRMLQTSNPQIPKVALIEIDDRESVVDAFRAGARGIFCLAASSFQLLCECIRQVHWRHFCKQTATELSARINLPSSTHARGRSRRAEPADVSRRAGRRAGRRRSEYRDVATELGLSEHTVKKYLFTIFDKLGISNRVELVLYAFHHGAPQAAAWAATA